MKKAVDEADQEKALKDVAKATAKDKGKATEDAEKRAREVERARVLAEEKLTKMDMKLGETEFKLAKAESLSLAQAKKIAELKAALEAYEEKWHNEGFTDAENFVEPIVHLSRRHRFGEGWIAALQAMGVSDDSPLRNLERIPFLEPSPLIQNPIGTEEEKDTPSMRELVQEINSHVELVDLEIVSNLDAMPCIAPSPSLDPVT